ncbi:Uncharacterised protein [Metamycoplasma cloacale]|uniref:Uncharacterized protein n=1 Tax=Metamycoplasma cloacale TaxID=92401 RepID=A0A2Z4LL85_9BACT|nr:hypothetical protein [Metamycoplasma cloacale]AWX42492.1 hypothetical protein DK849_00110 [Metamycoplasma cloacale]VEU79162.1 Uncharacterised protein [Metamycoplasma cloacale]
MIKKNFNKKILLTIGTISTISAPLLSISCVSIKPEMHVNKENATFDKEKGIHILNGSASAFISYVRLNQNPISPSDKAYDLYVYETTETGEYKLDDQGNKIIKLEKDNKTLMINKEHIPTALKATYAKYIKLDKLLAGYDFRMVAYTYEEFKRHYPYAASKWRYAQYKDNPNAVILALYYAHKSYESAPNFKALVDYASNYFGITYDRIEEGAWPVLPDMYGDKKSWDGAIDPIVLVFNQE